MRSELALIVTDPLVGDTECWLSDACAKPATDHTSEAVLAVFGIDGLEKQRLILRDLHTQVERNTATRRRDEKFG